MVEERGGGAEGHSEEEEEDEVYDPRFDITEAAPLPGMVHVAVAEQLHPEGTGGLKRMDSASEVSVVSGEGEEDGEEVEVLPDTHVVRMGLEYAL